MTTADKKEDESNDRDLVFHFDRTSSSDVNAANSASTPNQPNQQNLPNEPAHVPHSPSLHDLTITVASGRKKKKEMRKRNKKKGPTLWNWLSDHFMDGLLGKNRRRQPPPAHRPSPNPGVPTVIQVQPPESGSYQETWSMPTS